MRKDSVLCDSGGKHTRTAIGKDGNEARLEVYQQGTELLLHGLRNGIISGGGMMKKDKKILRQLQSDANTPKHRLIDIEGKLRDEGFVRMANELSTIIWRLEYWQNKG